MIAATPLEERIADIITPAVEGLGLTLVRVRMIGGNRQTLQIMAERPDGTMDVGTCAALSRELSAVLDVEDPITGTYRLEVSSPGIDRPLTRISDFASYAGHLAKFELRQAKDGRKRWQGILAGVNADGEINLDTVQGETLKLPFAELVSARLVLTDALIAQSNNQETLGRPVPVGKTERTS